MTTQKEFDWNEVPHDTQYYDTRLHIALKVENKKVLEWVQLRNIWVKSPDYTSWIPLNEHTIKNPNYIES